MSVLMQALLKAIQSTKDQKERNTLSVLLAFVEKVHPDTLSLIETLIASSDDPTDTLILTYGALASSLPTQMKDQVVHFLVNHINQTTDPSILVHYIHSLGNTQSQVTKEILLNLLTHGNPTVQLATVYALRYSTDSVDVQNTLQYALESYPSEDLTEMVLRSIIAGAESEVPPINDRLFETILTASRGNNTELRMQLAYYIHLLGPKAPNNWSALLQSHMMKRGATWNENNRDYNSLTNWNSRNVDVRLYPMNKAYLWGKSFGVPQLHLHSTFGGFVGFGGRANPTSFKLFAKGVARAYAFQLSRTAFEALLSSGITPGRTQVENRLYASIAGRVLIDYKNQMPISASLTYPLRRSPHYTLLKYVTPIFVYIGFMSFEFTLSAQLGLDAGLRALLDNSASSVQGILMPSMTIFASADATGSILVSHVTHTFYYIHIYFAAGIG